MSEEADKKAEAVDKAMRAPRRWKWQHFDVANYDYSRRGRPGMPNRVSINVGLELEQRDKMVALAFERSREHGRMVSVSALIREAVESYLREEAPHVSGCHCEWCRATG